ARAGLPRPRGRRRGGLAPRAGPPDRAAANGAGRRRAVERGDGGLRAAGPQRRRRLQAAASLPQGRGLAPPAPQPGPGGPATRTLAIAAPFAGSGSAVDARATAELESRASRAEQATRAPTITVRLVCAASDAAAQVRAPEASTGGVVQDHPAGTDTASNPAASGSVSLTWTRTASSGPWFVTSSV